MGPSNLSLLHNNFNFCMQRKRVKSLKTGIAVTSKKNISQRLSLSGTRARFRWPLLVFCRGGSSLVNGIGILSVVVIPYGMLVDELFAGLLDEMFGLRWILFLRR